MNCFLLIFSRYSAFPPIAATARGGGMRTSSLRPASGRTQARILLSPAWHALPLFKQLQSVSAYSAPIMFFCFLLPLLRLTLPGYASGARRKHFGAAGSAHWLHNLQVMPPGRARGLRKLWKGILPASLSRGAEYAVPCIICPASCKRSSSRCVLHPLGIEYHPASLETDSESLFTRPGTAAGCRFAKTGQSRRAAPSAGAARFIVS